MRQGWEWYPNEGARVVSEVKEDLLLSIATGRLTAEGQYAFVRRMHADAELQDSSGIFADFTGLERLFPAQVAGDSVHAVLAGNTSPRPAAVLERAERFSSLDTFADSLAKVRAVRRVFTDRDAALLWLKGKAQTWRQMRGF